MKKIFTFLTVAIVAMAANAQVIFDATTDINGEAFKATVDGVATYWCSAAANGYAFKENAQEVEGISFVGYYSASKDNPKVDGAAYTTESTTAPNTGSALNITPAKSGNLTVYVIVNASKSIFVTEDGIAINFSLNGNAMEPGETISEKVYGAPITFPVTAGKTYTVFCNGSKMGFYGFNLVAAASVDKTKLAEVIAAAQEKGIDATLIAAALDVYDTADATQDEVDAAYTKLNNYVNPTLVNTIEATYTQQPWGTSYYDPYLSDTYGVTDGMKVTVEKYSNGVLRLKNWFNSTNIDYADYNTVDIYTTGEGSSCKIDSIRGNADMGYDYASYGNYIWNIFYTGNGTRNCYVYPDYCYVDYTDAKGYIYLMYLDMTGWTYGTMYYSYYLTWDTTTTGINAATVAPAKAGKFIENGKLVIVKNGKKYNAAGALLK